MRINLTKLLYLLLAIAGLAFPIYFVAPVLFQVECISSSGCALPPGTAEAAWNAVIAESLVIYFAWMVSMFGEARTRGISRWWIYPLLTLVSPFAFVFCLFLFVQASNPVRSGG